MIKLKDASIIRDLIIQADANRKCLVELANKVGPAHVGGSLSSCDFLTALYGHFLNINPENLNDPGRDRFVLSKGHNGVMLYCIFANMGIIEKDDLFNNFLKFNTPYNKHTNRKYVPGFEISSGSLGHGLGMAVGMAQDARMTGSDHKVFVLAGDGELEEGSNWEAIMIAGFHKYGNLVAAVDCNGYQGTRAVKDINLMDENAAERFRSFGWNVVELSDGNNMIDIYEALNSLPEEKEGAPTAIILHTQKACGIKIMQEAPTSWHSGAIGDDIYDACISSLDERLNEELCKLDSLGIQ